jgi:hypothetical protein
MQMFPCHGSLAILAVVGLIFCGMSWLYWLREIGSEVNKTLPEDQRVHWGLTEKVPARMHQLWMEHEKQFPNSRKRMYAALSFLLVFLIPITAMIACILLTSPR